MWAIVLIIVGVGAVLGAGIGLGGARPADKRSEFPSEFPRRGDNDYGERET